MQEKEKQKRKRRTSLYKSKLRNTTTTNSPDFLSKLNLLRALFTSSDGNSTTYSEKKLTDSLKFSGYNVELAAERLITGFECGRPNENTVISIDDDNESINTNDRKRPSSYGKNTAISVDDESDSIKTNDRNKRLSHEKETPLKKLKIPIHEKENPSKKLNIPIQTSNGMDCLLLCQRWIVGFSTTRHGSIQYKEPLHFSVPLSKSYSSSLSKNNSSPLSHIKHNKNKGASIVRFTGLKVEGTLDAKLSAILYPLMLDNEGIGGDGSYIRVEAEGLMEDFNLGIGSEIPLQVRVYIMKPEPFFQLFDNNSSRVSSNKNGENQSHNFMFFKAGNGRESKDQNCLMAHSAFSLLQFSEYGMFPTIKHDGGNELNDNDNDTINQKEVVEEDIEINLQLNEEKSPEWAETVFSHVRDKKKKTDTLPEATEPDMLTNKGVNLRCYQRQALHWMMEREQKDEKSKDQNALALELELLSELAKSNSNSGVCGSTNIHRGKGISCEIGPVIVSDNLSQTCPTLDGIVNPVTHPLWTRRFLWNKSIDNNGEDERQRIFSFYVNELVQTASKHSPNPPKQAVGGILADAMGLGKTVMVLSLLCREKEQISKKDTDRCLTNESHFIENAVKCIRREMGNESDKRAQDSSSPRTQSDTSSSISQSESEKERNHMPTLIVTPLSLIEQWKGELESKTTLKYHIHYGTEKGSSPHAFGEVDVVLTTYGTLQSEFLAKYRGDKICDTIARDDPPLLSHSFGRVILDEAHIIKNPKTSLSKACCKINADKRWCITGTPIQNSLQDVYGHEPWCEAGFWKTAITSVMTVDKTKEKNGSHSEMSLVSESLMKTALDRVRRVLAPLILRRTKDTLDADGKPILILPDLSTKTISVCFTQPEREFYNALLHKSISVFDGFLRKGTASKSWFAIFSLLQKLRQACNHPALTVKSHLESTGKKKNNAWPVKFESSLDQKNCSPGSILQEESKSTLNNNYLESLLEMFNLDCVHEGYDSSKNLSVEESTKAHDEKLAAQRYVNKFAQMLSRSVKSSNNKDIPECPICLDYPKLDSALFTPCAHAFCRECLVDSLNRNICKKKNKEQKIYTIGEMSFECTDGKCPVCHTWVNCGKIIFVSQLRNAEPTIKFMSEVEISTKSEGIHKTKMDKNARKVLEAALTGRKSAKLTKVLEEMDKIWSISSKTKILVFSQFIGFLDLLQNPLEEKGIKLYRLDGSMSLKERSSSLEKFSSADDGRHVFLASMKAAGVGINLVAASCVFICDPWWNAAVEEQCISRVCRIGQKSKVVEVRKFVVSDSVEEKIVSLQQRKKGMANEVLSDEGNNSGMLSDSKPTINDFKMIFK